MHRIEFIIETHIKNFFYRIAYISIYYRNAEQIKKKKELRQALQKK